MFQALNPNRTNRNTLSPLLSPITPTKIITKINLWLLPLLCTLLVFLPTKVVIYFFLQEFGHHVRLATHANFQSFVESAGVDFYPLGGDARILAACKRFILINKFSLYLFYHIATILSSIWMIWHEIALAFAMHRLILKDAFFSH